MDRWAAANPESRLASVPAPDARRIRAGGQGPARRRRRRHRVPAARHDEPGVRQHRRHAELLAGAAARLPARRQPDQPPRGRRSRGGADHGDAPRAGDRKPDALRRGHAVRIARRHRVRAHLPGRRHLPIPRDAGAHGRAASCSATPPSTWRGKKEQLEISVNGERVAVLEVDQRHERRRREGADARDAADRRSRRVRSASPPRSCRARSVRSTICWRRSIRR